MLECLLEVVRRRAMETSCYGQRVLIQEIHTRSSLQAVPIRYDVRQALLSATYCDLRVQ